MEAEGNGNIKNQSSNEITIPKKSAPLPQRLFNEIKTKRIQPVLQSARDKLRTFATRSNNQEIAQNKSNNDQIQKQLLEDDEFRGTTINITFEKAVLEATTREQMPAPRAIEDEGFNYINSDYFQVDPDSDLRAFPDDPSLQKVVNLLTLWTKRAQELDSTDVNALSVVEGLLREVNKKRAIANALRPGSFFGHGGYMENFDKLLAAGGLMSSVSRKNASLIKEGDEVPRWGRTDNPEANALFFYQADSNSTTTPGHYYSETKGHTNIEYYYPSESLIKHSTGIEVRSVDITKKIVGEVAVTNSPSSLLKGRLSNEEDDSTKLPLSEAYIRTTSDNYDLLRAKLISGGYSQEWVQAHLIPVQEDPLKWLPEHHVSEFKKTKLKKLKGSFYTGELS